MQSVRFDRAVSYYDATRGFAPGVAERIRDAIVAQTGATPRTRFLELGVGTGRIALPFLAAGYRYVGVDLSRPMMEVMRAKLPSEQASPALVGGDVTRLPFATAAFDVVVGVHVLHLVADWRATLEEAGRVLRRPGQLLLAYEAGLANDTEAAEPPPEQAHRVWRTLVAKLDHAPVQAQPGMRPSDPAVRDALEGLGATVAEVDLGEYERLPRSAREVARAFRERIFSSDWARPEDVHSAALARLEQWLATECPDPDTPYPIVGRFRALAARWP